MYNMPSFGLTATPRTPASVGTLISFSTQPGNVALDGKGRNSPFAGALAKEITRSSEDLSSILIAVRNEVIKESNNKQVPWEHSALRARFFIAPPKAELPQTLAQPGPRSLADEAWFQIKDSDDAAKIIAYRAKYGNE